MPWVVQFDPPAPATHALLAPSIATALGFPIVCRLWLIVLSRTPEIGGAGYYRLDTAVNRHPDVP